MKREMHSSSHSASSIRSSRFLTPERHYSIWESSLALTGIMVQIGRKWKAKEDLEIAESQLKQRDAHFGVHGNYKLGRVRSQAQPRYDPASSWTKQSIMSFLREGRYRWLYDQDLKSITESIPKAMVNNKQGCHLRNLELVIYKLRTIRQDFQKD